MHGIYIDDAGAVLPQNVRIPFDEFRQDDFVEGIVEEYGGSPWRKSVVRRVGDGKVNLASVPISERGGIFAGPSDQGRREVDA